MDETVYCDTDIGHNGILSRTRQNSANNLQILYLILCQWQIIPFYYFTLSLLFENGLSENCVLQYLWWNIVVQISIGGVYITFNCYCSHKDVDYCNVISINNTLRWRFFLFPLFIQGSLLRASSLFQGCPDYSVWTIIQAMKTTQQQAIKSPFVTDAKNMVVTGSRYSIYIVCPQKALWMPLFRPIEPVSESLSHFVLCIMKVVFAHCCY